jgi:predicted small secreted protein
MYKKEGMVKRACLYVLCGLLILAVAGCSTIKGLGDDISTVGSWLMKGSDAVKEGPAEEK